MFERVEWCSSTDQLAGLIYDSLVVFICVFVCVCVIGTTKLGYVREQSSSIDSCVDM